MQMRKNSVKKPMIIMLIFVGILFGGIFAYKAVMNMFMKRFFATQTAPTVTVSTTKVTYSDWQPSLRASGSTRAIRGVDVTTQLAGMIQTIYLTPGAEVKEGDVLVQLNADPDIAQLHSLQANATLAKITYERDVKQFKFQAISKQQLDSDLQNMKSLDAQVAQQKATIAMKTIVAPFNGRLGISKVNPGQYLSPGDKVVSLQTLDPIYVDFYVPQQQLPQLQVGQEVVIKTDAFPNAAFKGKITTIDPAVNQSTRNVEVEATVENPDLLLAPGMFMLVNVDAGHAKPYLTLPQTAITFNPYGDIVFLVKESKDSKGKEALTVQQAFVVTGETRGDQITILDGVKEGDTVVTSGQLKLKNGSHIIVNNTVQPSDNPDPKVLNDHGE